MKTLEQIQAELQAPLKGNEIDLRVGRKNKNGSLSLLCYKDARCDAKRLDKVVGCFGWQREHTFLNGINYCTVSIKNPETGEWIRKQDCGTESKTEAEKGQSSDSFKRACFAFGIGRELYDMPIIDIDAKYEYKLRYMKIDLAYFKQGTDFEGQLAVMVIRYGNEVVFKFAHPNYKKEDVFVP
jgi:hypothetical protein